MNRMVATEDSRSLRIAGIATLCTLFVVLAAVFDLDPYLVIAILLAVVVLSALPKVVPWVAHKTRNLDLFAPWVGFPIAYIFWFVGGSINFIEAPSEIAFGSFDPIPAWMYGLYAWGLAGYFAGIAGGRFLPTRKVKAAQPQIDMAKMQTIVRWLVIGAVFFWLLTVVQFGLPILNPATAGEARLAFHGPSYQGFIILSWTAFVFSPVYIWARGGKRRFDWFWVVCVPFGLTLLLFSLGARANVVAPFVTLIIARYYFRRQAAWKIVAAALIAFCVFSLFGYFREAASSDQGALELLGLPAPAIPFIYSGLYVRYTVAALRDITQMIPSHFPYQYGYISTLPFATFLPGHQDMSDIFFKNMLGREFAGSGQPATLLAPLYADFGWPGVFLGMSAYGALLSWTFRKAQEKPTMANVILYAWWLENVLFGLYANGFAYINVYLMPLIFAALFRVARSGEQVPRPSTGYPLPGQ